MQKKDFQAFRCQLLGRSGVGKTYNGLKWAQQLVKNNVFHPKRILIISRTWKSDPSQKDFIDYCQSKYDNFKKSNCLEYIDIDLLKQIFDVQKQIKENKPSRLQNWLLIFDDQISSQLIKRQDKDPTLKDLFCLGRHYNISQIWMLQRWKSTIDPSCRDQFTIIAIFKQGNKKALLELLQDYDESPEKDHRKSVEQLYEWYIQSTQKNDSHGCFVIHVLNDWGKGKYQDQLDGQFYDMLQ